MRGKRVFLCILVFAALMCTSAMASSVHYEGGAEQFVFLPGSAYSDSDLFENFKDVLPGDELVQNITVTNGAEKEMRIYMRAESATPEDKDFLSQLHMTVSCKDKEIFDAAPSESAQLTENTLLGTFKKNGSTELTVTLTVPAELENEYMGDMGTVRWTFLVEEVALDDSPQTGDWFVLWRWILAAAIIAACIVVICYCRSKRNTEA